MSVDQTQTQVDTNVVETEADKVEVQTEVKTEVETEQKPEKTPKEIELENDNFKQREEIRGYKDTITNLTTELATLQESYNSLKATLDAKQEAEAKVEKEKNLNAALDKAGIIEEGHRKLAVRLLKDSENIEADLKQVITEYPFITGKKVTLPDTGKANSKDKPASEISLREGLAEYFK